MAYHSIEMIKTFNMENMIDFLKKRFIPYWRKMQNKIIINADDFGLCESCSKAIIEAFKQNLISSATAMANGEYIKEAYKLAEENGFVDRIGVHIVLTEGKPLTEKIKNDPFFCENGFFHGKINRMKRPNQIQLDEIREELSAQIEKLRDLGFSISHADSHHHIHTDVFFIKTIERVLIKYGINKIRIHRNFGKIPFYKKIVKDCYNQKLTKHGFSTTEKMGSLEDLANFSEIIRNHFCEIMVHPDFNANGEIVDRIDWKNNFAIGENLTKINNYITDFKLISYRDI